MSTEIPMHAWSLNNWVNEIWKTFESNDKKRSPADIWASVVIYSSVVAEGLRKARYDEVFRGIAHTFVWMASFVAKCTKDDQLPSVYKLVDSTFENVLALMYPDCCGHCEAKPCSCSLNKSRIEDISDKKLNFEALKNKRSAWAQGTHFSEWKLDQWVNLLNEIYEPTVRFMPIDSVGFHLAEEIGEAAKSLRELQHLEGNTSISGSNLEEKKLELQIEIAQSFSWLCSLFLRIRHILEGLRHPVEKRMVGDQKKDVVDIEIAVKPPKSETVLALSDLLIHRFASQDGKGFVCDDCGKSPCKCTLYLVDRFGKERRIYEAGGGSPDTSGRSSFPGRTPSE